MHSPKWGDRRGVFQACCRRALGVYAACAVCAVAAQRGWRSTRSSTRAVRSLLNAGGGGRGAQPGLCGRCPTWAVLHSLNAGCAVAAQRGLCCTRSSTRDVLWEGSGRALGVLQACSTRVLGCALGEFQACSTRACVRDPVFFPQCSPLSARCRSIPRRETHYVTYT